MSHGVAEHLHLIAFGLLLLSGFNVPVSEDLVFIASASIVAAIIPENVFIVFLGCFLGAFTSDIIAYMLGRHGLVHLSHARFFKTNKVNGKIARVKTYFDRYGGKTLFFGRFIPFGFRNVMFLTAGMVKVSFPRFLVIDLAALSISSTLLFYIGFEFGENMDAVLFYLNKYKMAAFTLAGVAVVAVLLVRRFAVCAAQQEGD